MRTHPSRASGRARLTSGITAIAYETLRDAKGNLPLLTPMSEVAGRMSIQEGAKYLERPQEGRGILLAGVPGVAPARVTVIGGGVSEAGELLLRPTQEEFAASLTGRGFRPLAPVRLAALGPDAGLVGAADLARRRV